MKKSLALLRLFLSSSTSISTCFLHYLKKCDEGFHALLVSLIVAQSLLQAINDSLPCR